MIVRHKIINDGVLLSSSSVGQSKTSKGAKVFHSNTSVSRTPYTRKQGFTGALLALAIPLLAVLTETQLAAYGLEEEGAEKAESGSGKEGLNNFVGLLRTWMPFTNEFLGVFNIWGKIIDMIAATAILWNTVDEVEEYGKLSGFLKGVGLLIFSFFGPEWFIPKFQDFFAGIFNQHSMFTAHPPNPDGSKNKSFLGFGKLGRIAAGFVSIIILESCVKLWDLYVIPLFEDGVQWLRSKFKAKKEEASASDNMPVVIGPMNKTIDAIPGILKGAARRRLNAKSGKLTDSFSGGQALTPQSL